jgi:uncharacterized damage-inducible protein DinB
MSTAAADDLKTVLHRYLQEAREALLWKVEGASEYDVRRPLTRTGTNLLGIVKHVASVEDGYLGECFGRPSGLDLPWFDEGAEPNADFLVEPGHTRAQVTDLYRTVMAHSDRTVAALDLDAPGQVPWWGAQGQVTLGRILVHITTETHRHAGHADIVRELVDGQVGLRPGAENLPDAPGWSWQRFHDRVERAARMASAG